LVDVIGETAGILSVDRNPEQEFSHLLFDVTAK
jgi:hypothetical protein